MNRSRVTGDLTASGLLYADIANDRVGIGTTIPSESLEIANSVACGIAIKDDNNGFAASKIKVENGGRDLSIGAPQDIIFKDIDTGTKHLYIESTGHIGIGTDNPARPLHIEAADCRIRLTDSDVTTDVELQNSSGDAVLTTNGASNLRFQTNNNERLRILSDGSIGINSTSPAKFVDFVGITDVDSQVAFANNTKSKIIQIRPNDNTIINYGSDFVLNAQTASTNLTFQTGGSERLRIDSSGRLLIGTTSNRVTRLATNSFSPKMQLEDDTEAAFSMSRFINSNGPPRFVLQKARGTGASPVVVQNNDDIGQILFSGWDGDTFTNGAEILAEVDGTPGDDQMPGRLVFKTNTGGTATTTRMTIKADGKIGINVVDPTTKLQIGSGTVDSSNVITLGKRVSSSESNLPKIGHHSANGASSSLALCATSSSGRIHFFTGNGGDGFGASSNAERMVITSGGNIGIGTISPESARLHVYNETADAHLTVETPASGKDARLNLYAHNTGVSQIRLGDDTDTNIGRITYYHAASGNNEANSLEIITGDYGRVRVASSGLVLPQTTNEIRTDSSDGSDNKRIILAAGGDNSQSRGAQIAMYGNEYSSHEGRLQLLAGNSGNTNGVVQIYTGGEEKVRIDSSGRLLVGHTAAIGDLHGPQTTTNRNPFIQIHGANASSAGAALISWKNSAGSYYAPTLYLAHSGSDTIGTNGILPANGEFGSIVFSGDDGTDFVKGAMIKARLDGTPGDNDMPGRLEFYTTPDSAQEPEERLRIKSNGQVHVGSSQNSSAIFGVGVNDDTVLSDSGGLYNSSATNFLEVSNTGDAIGGKESGILLRTRTSGCGVWAIYNKRTGTYLSDLVFRTRTGASTNAERLRIKSDGNIGMGGNTNPTNVLHIKTSVNNTAVATIESTATNSYPFLRLKNDAREYQLTCHGTLSDAFTIYDGTAGAHRLTITSGGNVDINGTPPWTVSGGDYRNLSISGNSASSSGFLWLGNGAAATNADFDLGRINFCNGGTIVARVVGTTDTSANDDGRLRFITKETGATEKERMRINSNGTVNIGGENEVQLTANNHEILHLHGAVVGADVDQAWGLNIDMDDDNVGTTTADRERGCIHLDFHGNCTGGDTSNETRIWNIHSDVEVSGDYDDVRGFYSDLMHSSTSGTTSNIFSIYGYVQKNNAGAVSNMYGVYGIVQNTTGSSGTVNDMVGVRGRVNLSAGSGAGTATDIMGIWANIDNDNNVTQPSGGKCALFYGSYDKTTGLASPYGLRIDTDVPNYLRGDLYIDGGGIFSASATHPNHKIYIKNGTNATGILLEQTGNQYNTISADANRSSAENAILDIRGYWSGTQVAKIRFETGTDTTNKDDGEIQFSTASAGTVTERMHIQPNGEIAMKSDGAPADALANLHVQNGTFRVSQSSNPTTAYTQITAHTSGQDGNRHRIATWNTADICSFAVDHNGTVMARASSYAGRTRGDANNAQPEMYRHGAHQFSAYSARTDDATVYRTVMMMRAWDAGDRGDRNILYYADSNSDTTTCDYDQHQTFGVKADGSVHGLVRFFSGRVESDESSPNSVYGSGRGGIYGYEADSVANIYMLAEAGGSSSTYSVFQRTSDNDVQWKHRTSDGRMYVDASATTFNGADYAEYFEWSDGNSSNQDRAGYTVVLKDGSKIGIATAGDSPSSIIGVISASPAIVGDGQDLSWRGKWKKDVFGREITTPVQYLVWNHGYEDDENGNRVPVKQPDPTDQMSMQNADSQGEVGTKLNKMIADGKVPQFAIDNNIIMNATRRVKDPLYDETKKYVPREFRQEWSPVGLVGKLIVRKGQVVGDRWIKMKDINDQLEQWMIR